LLKLKQLDPAPCLRAAQTDHRDAVVSTICRQHLSLPGPSPESLPING
jgi:hypothetical protein